MTTPTAAPTSTTPKGSDPAPTQEPVKTEPVKTEPVKTEPVKTEPVKTEPKAADKKPEAADLTSDDEGTDGSEAAATDIEITVPEGVEVDKEALGSFKAFAKELKLDSKASQKIFDRYVEEAQRTEQAVASAWNERKQQWREAARTDKEIGGKGYDENLKAAKTVMQKIGGPEFVKALRDLDIGAHPEMIRFMYRVSRLVSEDSLADLGGSRPAGSGNKDDQYRAAFPSMFKDEKTE